MFDIRHVAVALSVLLICAPVGAVATSTDGGNAGNTSQPVCFPGDGHRIDMGDEGLNIDLVVHTSLFQNLLTKGGVGMEAYGKIGNTTIVALRTGVIFMGVDNPRRFVSNPFSRFALAFDYLLRLPMFEMVTGDDYSYDSDKSGIEGVNETDCGWDTNTTAGSGA